MRYYAQKEEINILENSSSSLGELSVVYRDNYRVFSTSDGLRNGKWNENNCAALGSFINKN